MRWWTKLAVPALVVLFLAGCRAQNAAGVPTPPAPVAAEHPGGGQPAAQAPGPAEVKLVPLDAKWNLPFALSVPEGWNVSVTALKDEVQILNPPLQVLVATRQLRAKPAPRTVAEMKQSVASWAPTASVTQVTRPGAVSAFELRYPTQGDGKELTVLTLDMYGKAYHQSLTFIAPTEQFGAWEPLFRKIMASFQPAALDAAPLPGRP